MTDDDILDDLIMGCALTAFIDQAIEQAHKNVQSLTISKKRARIGL
jgi:hypothetical protein